jgi:hypothetical protein
MMCLSSIRPLSAAAGSFLRTSSFRKGDTLTNWYLSENGGVAGPFAFELLRQLASSGRLKPSDRVRPEGQAQWSAASDVPGLFPVTEIATELVGSPLLFRAVEVTSKTNATYWLLEGGVPSGPYSKEHLETSVREGKVLPTAKVCKLGTDAWFPMNEVIGIAKPNNPSAPPAPPSPGAPQLHDGRSCVPVMAPAPTPSSARVWHPVTLALLGIPFTPLWTGVMAALNSERLGLKTTLIRPVAIAAGAFALDLIGHRASAPIWFSFALYFGSLLSIWSTDLVEQWDPYRQARQTGAKSAGLSMPVLAGVVLVGVCLTANDYLYPPDFREICNRFAQASDVAGKKQLCTESLWSAFGHRVVGEVWDVELLDDFVAKPPLTGRFVSFRQPFVDNNRILMMHGAFHVVRSGESWLIAEIMVTNDGFGPLAQPVALGAQIAANNPPPIGRNPWGDPNQTPLQKPAFVAEKKPDAGLPLSPRQVGPLALLLSKSKVPAVIIAAVCGIFGFFRRAVSGPSIPPSAGG